MQFDRVRESDGAELLIARGQHIDCVPLLGENRHRLVVDLEHSYTSHHGDVWCCSLPRLGTPISAELKPHARLADGTELTEARSVYQAIIAADNIADSVKQEVFDWGTTSQDLVTSRGTLPQQASRKIFVGSIGYIREHGVYHPNALLSQSTFFVMDPLEQVAPFAAVGDVYGLVIRDFVVENPALIRRTAVLGLRAGGAAVASLGIDDMDMSFRHGGLRAANPAGFQFFIRDDNFTAIRTPASDGATDIAIVGRYALAFKDDGGLVVPMAGCVMRIRRGIDSTLDAALEEIRQTGTVPWALPQWGSVKSAFQSGPQVLVDGRLGIPDSEYPAYSLEADATSIPFSAREAWDDQLVPKAVLGLLDTGELMHISGERRSARTLAGMLKDHGARWGVMLDGGGSTCAFLGNGVLFANREPRRNAYANWERPIPLALALASA